MASVKITHRYTKEQYPQDIYRQVITLNNSGMDKYERRRQNLLKLRDTRCAGKAATLAQKLGRSPNYVSRMLYEQDKEGRKRIADDMVDLIEERFELPRGWLDDLTEIADGEKPQAPVIDMQFYAKDEDERRLLRSFRGLQPDGGGRLRVLGALADELKKEKAEHAGLDPGSKAQGSGV
jgi:hypothetical protein